MFYSMNTRGDLIFCFSKYEKKLIICSLDYNAAFTILYIFLTDASKQLQPEEYGAFQQTQNSSCISPCGFYFFKCTHGYSLHDFFLLSQ